MESNNSPLTLAERADLKSLLDRWGLEGRGAASLAYIKRCLPRALQQIEDQEEAISSLQKTEADLRDDLLLERSRVARLEARLASLGYSL